MKFNALVEDRVTRGLRLAILVAVIALIFAPARLYALAILAALLFIYGIRQRRRGGLRYVTAIALIGLFGGIALIWADHERGKVERFRELNRPIDLSYVPDGAYVGVGPGNNGPIRVKLHVAHGRVAKIDILENHDAAYAFDDALPKLIGAERLVVDGPAGFVFRNERSLAGLQAALEDAAAPAIFDAPRLPKWARAVFFATSNQGGRIAVNALAILFIALMAFDYTLGPALRPGLGQSLNCYNCQACVGVCPVKMVAGDPFPMTMVLMARLGDVERVVQLAKYCVGCGKCAAKCPVGNSGPSVASAAYLIWRERHRREQARRDREIRTLTGEAQIGDTRQNRVPEAAPPGDAND